MFILSAGRKRVLGVSDVTSKKNLFSEVFATEKKKKVWFLDDTGDDTWKWMKINMCQT